MHLCLCHMPTVPFLKEQMWFPDLNECGPDASSPAWMQEPTRRVREFSPPHHSKGPSCTWKGSWGESPGETLATTYPPRMGLCGPWEVSHL